ncbi:hypothetical protein EC396_11115 [Lutibacter sp. HS1-25]|uniref:helix-turn-helix transcriptional regulator n=1 Tax=Lutibacter sp. HS1-25 TaxID=2485000 RepID=UPI001012A1BF|nr:LuxR C-terminal-related transcriptional regulator [Lutibacter sp. HS1-25]RXP52512.1 hypothetical protein EC396_11115 [Lutibacter sp. HS1-25]
MLNTKLNSPKFSKSLVSRFHLINELEKNNHVPFVLITAPAGYGKSMLISQWVESKSYKHCWLSLEKSMNDTATFLTYFIEMLEKCSSGTKSKLKNLNLDYHFLSWEAIIEVIINELNKLNEPGKLILDDYHLIDNPEIHKLISSIINGNISNLQLVVITRKDPPLQLRKLLLYQKMLKLNYKDLKFKEEELLVLLAMEYNVRFSANEITELLNKTEGWILAIKMILMSTSLLGLEDKNVKSGILTNNLDMLLDHISESLDADFFKKVQLCALCEQFNEELTESIFKYVFGYSFEANSFITELKGLNLFLIPIKGKTLWFRFHHLFGDILRMRLEKNEPTIIKPLYIHISLWFSKNGFVSEAIKYALKVEDYDLASNIIIEHKKIALDNGEWWVVKQWLEKIPEHIKKSNVELLLTELRICEDTYDHEKVVSLLGFLELLGVEKLDYQTKAIYLFHKGYYFTFFVANTNKAIAFLEESNKLYKNDSFFGARRELTLAIAKQMKGETALVLKSLDCIRQNSQPSSIMNLRSLNAKVFVNLLSGNLKDAWFDVKNFNFIAENCNFKVVEANSWYLRENIAFQLFNEDVLMHSFKSFKSFQGILNYRMYFDAIAALILYFSLKGNDKKIAFLLQEMSDMTSKLKDVTSKLYHQSIRARINWHIGQGEKELSWAQTDWVKQYPSAYFFLIDTPNLTKIRIIVSHGTVLQVEEALKVLAEVESFLKKIHNNFHTIDIKLLKAMALLRLGRNEMARTSLTSALFIAEEKQHMSAVMEAYLVMPSLFDLVEKNQNLRRFLSRIGLKSKNNEFHTISYTKSNELSVREQEVVGLIEKGLPNKEIAHQLNISISTVKCHLTNIFRKLDVPNRISMLNKLKN